MMGLDHINLDKKDRLIITILPRPVHFAHILAKQTECVYWLFANHPFSPKKRWRGIANFRTIIGEHFCLPT
jgi:hypothetical protein